MLISVRRLQLQLMQATTPWRQRRPRTQQLLLHNLRQASQLPQAMEYRRSLLPPQYLHYQRKPWRCSPPRPRQRRSSCPAQAISTRRKPASYVCPLPTDCRSSSHRPRATFPRHTRCSAYAYAVE